MNNSRDELTVHLERAILVSVALPQRPWLGDDPLDELRGLAATAGAVVVGDLLQKREHIIPATYIGKGKLMELQERASITHRDYCLRINQRKTLCINAGSNSRKEKQLRIFLKVLL